MLKSLRGYRCAVLLFLAQLVSAEAAVVNATWNSATDTPVTASSYTATGNTLNFTLNFAPRTGANLTVVNNTGLPFISGTFSNLVEGQLVELTYAGQAYHFLASYYGGSGNDLVLQWADTRACAWGANSYQQLGTQSSSTGMVPLVMTGALSQRSIRMLAAGARHSLALCWDGTLAAWGDNSSGQLGLHYTTSSTATTPVAVNVSDASSALYGKTVVAVAAGDSHSLALCSDGTVVAWGGNADGQLGIDLATTQSDIPIAVNSSSGVSDLSGRSVVAIAAGASYSLALCTDGTVVGWGDNSVGQLGNLTFGLCPMPVAVSAASGVSALNGKSVISLAAGSGHSLALCSDGTVVAWGSNANGQLGFSTTASGSSLPVAVSTAQGSSALYGKTVVAVSAGYAHSLALCSDGTVTAWGANDSGQLGDNSGNPRNPAGVAQSLPVLVNTSSGTSALYGKTVTSVTAGFYHSLACCSDGTLAVWGSNTHNEIGLNVGAGVKYPVKAAGASIRSYELCASVFAGPSALHSLALVATPPITITPDAPIVPTSSTVFLGGYIYTGQFASIALSTSLDYGLTSAYGMRISGLSFIPGGTHFSIFPSGFTPGTTYHYRINGGSYSSPDLTFTTLTLQQEWRQQNFSTSANTGNAADTADYDGDGIPNLLEYALNLNPKTVSRLPVGALVNGANFEYTYTRSTSAVNAGTAYTVEWSPSLSAGSWSSAGVAQTVLSDDGTTQQVKAVIPMSAANSMFVHLSVTAPP
ncbi:RCC1 domain-containing protein [Prosthecobacter vanneervenii]|uniref:Alpha-tubulin suppressor-like RCC1 family protein n=1 Tax=Prosthecobacter vanneervenii TaxID=48466 RepID=A0A7W7Y7S2_9BACT|nr:hypothetical protein [Prosthecobacter vanneervenii]MBB5031207.1 alpha-tubulin suppressor-like RCC1 family protein [Prosthecobacter vanneervenii]